MPVMTTGSFTGATVPTVPGNVLKLMIAAARETPQLVGNLSSLVFNDPLPSGSGTTWNSPKFGTLVAYSLTEGVDHVNQQNIAVTNVVITPGEVGLQLAFTKKSLAQWSEKVATRAGGIMKRAIDRKKDTDVGGLFASLTLTGGAAAAVMSLGHLSAAVARLTGGANTTGTAITAGTGFNVTDGPFRGVFRPESLHVMWVAMVGAPAFAGATAKTAPGISGGLPEKTLTGGVQSLFSGHLAGVDLYRCSNLAKDATDDCVGAVFSEMAMVFVPFRHEGAGGDIHTVTSDDGRSLLMTIVEDYGFGILDGNLGVAVTLDATAPTS